MAASTPISPPPLSTTASPPADPPNPISPVSRTGTFPHKTSVAVPPARLFIETDTPAVNAEPVELDGVPTSPDELKRRGTGDKDVGAGVVSPGLGEEEDINEEFLGEGEVGVGRGLREKRAAILASRSKDPGVIVDVPQEPTAEEVEAAKSADGTVTPGMPSIEFENTTENKR